MTDDRLAQALDRQRRFRAGEAVTMSDVTAWQDAEILAGEVERLRPVVEAVREFRESNKRVTEFDDVITAMDQLYAVLRAYDAARTEQP